MHLLSPRVREVFSEKEMRFREITIDYRLFKDRRNVSRNLYALKDSIFSEVYEWDGRHVRSSSPISASVAIFSMFAIFQGTRHLSRRNNLTDYRGDDHRRY